MKKKIFIVFKFLLCLAIIQLSVSGLWADCGTCDKPAEPEPQPGPTPELAPGPLDDTTKGQPDKPQWEMDMFDAEILSLPLEGESPLLGPIKIRLGEPVVVLDTGTTLKRKYDSTKKDYDEKIKQKKKEREKISKEVREKIKGKYDKKYGKSWKYDHEISEKAHKENFEEVNRRLDKWNEEMKELQYEEEEALDKIEQEIDAEEEEMDKIDKAKDKDRKPDIRRARQKERVRNAKQRKKRARARKKRKVRREKYRRLKKWKKKQTSAGEQKSR